MVDEIIEIVKDISAKPGDEKTNGNGTLYSHSKLWLYESCPEFYKLKYIDKIQDTIQKARGVNANISSRLFYHQIYQFSQPLPITISDTKDYIIKTLLIYLIVRINISF